MYLYVVCIGQWLDILVEASIMLSVVVSEAYDHCFLEPFHLGAGLGVIDGLCGVLRSKECSQSSEELGDKLQSAIGQ